MSDTPDTPTPDSPVPEPTPAPAPTPADEPVRAPVSGPTGAATVPIWMVGAAAAVCLALGLVGGLALFGGTSDAASSSVADDTVSASGDATTTTVPDSTTTLPTTTTTTEPERTPQPGDWDDPLPVTAPIITTGGAEIVINSVDFNAHETIVADSLFGTPSDGVRMVLVNFTITNTGDEAILNLLREANFRSLGSLRRVHGGCSPFSFPDNVSLQGELPAGESATLNECLAVPVVELEDQSFTILAIPGLNASPTFRYPDWSTAGGAEA